MNRYNSVNGVTLFYQGFSFFCFLQVPVFQVPFLVDNLFASTTTVQPPKNAAVQRSRWLVPQSRLFFALSFPEPCPPCRATCCPLVRHHRHLYFQQGCARQVVDVVVGRSITCQPMILVPLKCTFFVQQVFCHFSQNEVYSCKENVIYRKMEQMVTPAYSSS